MLTLTINNFDLKQIADSGQCFRWFPVDTNIYDIVAFGKVLRVSQIGNTVNFDCTEDEFQSTWNKYFDLERNYENIINQIDPSDHFLIRAYNYGSGIRILHQPLWETMVSFIISQRKSIPAIKTSIERLCHTYGHPISNSGYYSFPAPEQLTDLSLDNCGLGYRQGYIEKLASHPDVITNTDYESCKASLLRIRGVGEKVANCILLFGLGYVNAFPVDVWVQRVLNTHYSNGFPLNRYHEFSGILQQYMFYYIRNHKQEGSY